MPPRASIYLAFCTMVCQSAGTATDPGRKSKEGTSQMPTPTPQREGRKAKPGARFLSEVLADNIRERRVLRRFSQQQLADRMEYFGHRWVRATVSEVERGNRTVTVDELLSLAVVLGVRIPDLLDPAGIEGTRTDDLELGPEWTLAASNASEWVHGLGLIPTLGWDDERKTGGVNFEGDDPRDLPRWAQAQRDRRSAQ